MCKYVLGSGVTFMKTAVYRTAVHGSSTRPVSDRAYGHKEYQVRSAVQDALGYEYFGITANSRL